MTDFERVQVAFSVRYQADFCGAVKSPSDYLIEEAVSKLVSRGSVEFSDGCVVKLKALWLDDVHPVETILHGDGKVLVLNDKKESL